MNSLATELRELHKRIQEIKKMDGALEILAELSHIQELLRRARSLAIGWDIDDVKIYRRRLEISQAELADYLGVSTKTVSNWEQGIRETPAWAHQPGAI